MSVGKTWKGLAATDVEVDWREGVFVASLASRPAMIATVHGPMHDGNPTAVYYEAKCCLCEYMYDPEFDRLSTAGLPVTYAYSTPDIMEMMRWTGTHRSKGTHVRALHDFRSLQFKPKGQAAGSLPTV